MSCRRSPSAALAFSLHGNILHGPKSWHRCSLLVHQWHNVTGLLLPLFYPLFGAPKCNQLENRERDRVSALGGHLLVGQHNNQPKVGIRGRRDIGEGTQPWAEGVGRTPYHHFWWRTEQQNNKNNKICRGLKWPPINISNATTNQKHAGVMRERKARKFDQGGAWGKHDSIIFGAIELGGDKN
jgi:hypothetical protein